MTAADHDTQSSKSVKSAQGEDRSSFQAIRPWTTDRFGFAKATEGLTWTDPTFPENWAALRSEGTFRGAYHFLHTNLNAQAQAEFFLEYVQNHGGLIPGDMLVIDSELAGWGGALQTGALQSGMATPVLPVSGAAVGAGLAGDSTLAFLTRLGQLLGKDKDRHPQLVYSSLSVAKLLGNCTSYDLWIAYPADTAPPSVDPWPTWRFWQWGFGGGEGGGDRDAYNGTMAGLTQWIDSYKNPPGQAPATPGE